MSRWVGLAAGVGVLALAAAFGVGSIVGGHSTRVIPWSESVQAAVRYVPGAPVHAKGCSDQSVRLSGGEPIGVNSAESLYFVDVRNVTGTTCLLEGRPRIDLPRRVPAAISVADATGAKLPVPPPVPAGFPATGARFGLAPGMVARAGIAVLGICRNRLDERRVRVRASLPSGVKGVPLDLIACISSGTSLFVGAFTPPEQPVPKAHHWPLKITVELPKTVQRGERIDYRVRLTNVGARAFRFPSQGVCPEFDQRVTGSVDNPVDTLNCRPMGTLAPGKSAVFAMRLDLFPVPRAGSHSLIWHLADGTKNGLAVRQTFEINR